MHCPLTAENMGLVDARLPGLMKAGASLISTARGRLVREQDLADALCLGQAGGRGP
ncbi:MAG TPA: NAD(P)-dependent oxidoreductase [Phycisphaerae bacterium]|nr:NAD(P)-dependent oxidoreductase [Phycisphaerae bacterium]HRY68455.1 NAD(P)-dependent oxidoreductase [Phycisphaerae bacterium]HSA28509.1 NAD(P)-dependent oxidoreductase [Phycisphaerae bacterium]